MELYCGSLDFDVLLPNFIVEVYGTLDKRVTY